MTENNNIAKNFTIEGIYGEVNYHRVLSDKEAETSKYAYREINTQTGVKGESEYNIEGLPSEITKDDYFKMALLDVLRGIKDEIRKDSYVNIKSPNISIERYVDEALSKLSEDIKANTLKGISF